jgi:hypothetical protein
VKRNYLTFSEDALAVLDFARCQRADGSYYGTAGRCRKGKEVGPRETKMLKKAAAKGNKKAQMALDVVEGRKSKENAIKELRALDAKSTAAPGVPKKEEPAKPAKVELSMDGLKTAPDGSEVEVGDDIYIKKDGKYYWKKADGTLGGLDYSPKEIYEEASLKGVAVKPGGGDSKSLAGRYENAKILGEGGFAQVRRTEDGTVIKKGELGVEEVAAQKKLEGVDGVPKIKGNEGNLIEMELARGRAIMDTELLYDGPSKASAKAADELIRLNRDIHKRGVSHGDQHDGNFFYDSATGKGGLIDFGMARTSPVSALQEGLDLGSAGDYKSGSMLSDLAGPRSGGKGARPNAGPMLARFEENQQAVAKQIKADGFDPAQPLDRQGISSSQAEKYISSLYDGV